MKLRINRPSIPRALVCILPLALVACAGSTVIDVEVAPEVTRYTASGLRDSINRNQITVVPPSDRALNRFPARSFDGGDFEWSFSAGAQGFGGTITNKSSHAICFRFDEASVSSNLNPSDKPLRIWHMRWANREVVGWIGSTNPKNRQLVAPVKVCLKAGESLNVTIAPELMEQFPHGTMFDIRWREGSSEVLQDGAGNWILIRLPIENGGSKGRIDIKLTAVQARGRTSYY